MVHARFQVDCTEMCVGSACTQPSYYDKNISSVFVLISLCFTCLKLIRLTVWSHTVGFPSHDCWLTTAFQHIPALSELSS